MNVRWQENGIVLTAIGMVAASSLIVAELLVERRAPDTIIVAVEPVTETDPTGDDDAPTVGSTVPLYGSLDQLGGRAKEVLTDPAPNAELLHELARQARLFRDYALADTLLSRCLEIAPERVESRFLLARTQSDLGRAERAVQMYQEVLTQAPNHQKATYNLGLLMRRAGNLRQAEVLLRRAAAISSGRVKSKALYQLGLTLGATGRWDASAESIRSAVSLRPDAPRYWLALGSAELKRGRLDEAQVAYEKALTLNRRLADTHFALGLLYEQRGNRTRARTYLVRAAKLDDDNPAIRMALARVYLADGSRSKARSGFGWLAQNATGEADRAYAQSMLALLDGDSDRMLSQIKRADALRPGGYDDAVGQVAVALHGQGRSEDARTLLGLLLERSQPSPEALLAAARAASRMGQWTDAESLLRRSLQARPASSEAWFQLGRVLSERGDPNGAIDAYRESLARNPGARNARLNLAVLYARQRREEEALATYAQLLRAHPRYTPALVNRARLHERAGRVPDAVADMEAALRIASNDPDIRQDLAKLLLRDAQFERAHALLSVAVAERPANPRTRLLLAEAGLRAGQRDDALEELNRVAALAGDDAHLWSGLARLYREAGQATAAAQAQSRAALYSGASVAAITHRRPQTPGIAR